ncbi:MAG TPA: outer membrane beta-barrel protein [Acetobacteraceae bacterium]|nr:outer membrane beta-barrel protein [Acetobacteraceae bacterium]
MRMGWKVAVVALGCGVVGGGAAADWLDTLFPPGVPGYGTAPGVTVASRIRPETRPKGMRAGGFVLHPSWEQATGYDSNVLGGPAALGSWVVGTRPSLLVSSDWSRDALGAYVAADDRRDLDVPAQSRTDWTASVGGSLDIGRDRLTLAVAHSDSHQDRTDLDALPADRPVPFRVEDLRAAYAWSSGRWTVTPNLEASSWHFGATSILGAPAGQSYRDRVVLHGGTTVSYALAPQRSLVFVTRAIGQHYAHPSPGGSRLDSTGYQTLGGFDYDDDAVWRYRLLLGAEHRDFAAAGFPARAAVIAEAEIAWMPSGLTTVIASFTRSMEDAAQEGVAGYTYTNARVTLDHELRHDLLLHGYAGLQRADFLQGGTQQTAYSLGVGAAWLMNRRVRLSATYDLTSQHGPGTAALPLSGSYTRSLALLTLRFGL